MPEQRNELSAAITHALEALELCMGEDLRHNGCVCGESASGTCYLHGVTAPDAISHLRAVLESKEPPVSSAATDREFLTDVRVRASDVLTKDICALDPKADPADVHEDVREALWPFFLEIRDRFGVEGDV